MKTYLSIIIILTLSIHRICGQDPGIKPDPGKTWSLNLRTGSNQINEKILLPMVHKGVATEFAFEKEKIKGSLRQFEFLLTYSRLKTSLEEMAKSANIRIGIGYARNFQILKNKDFTYYLGPKVSLLYSFMMFPNWDESHSYWADFLSFSANNVFLVSLRKERDWFTTLSIPLLGFFSRPENRRPYKMDESTAGGVFKALNSNMESGFINKLMLINFKTEYRFPVLTTKREAFTLSMDFSRISKKEGSPVLQLTTMLGIKLML